MTRPPARSRDFEPIAFAGGVAVFLLGARAARKPKVGRLERDWFGWANRLHSRWHAAVWPVMQLGSLGGVAATSGAALWAGRPSLARRVGVAGTTAWVGAKAVKRFVGRGRPASVIAPARVLGREQTGLGYPSGHAAVVAAMAMAAAPHLGAPARRSAWALAAGVSGARVYVGAHLPLDVVGGAALGVACGAAARAAVRVTDQG